MGRWAWRHYRRSLITAYFYCVIRKFKQSASIESEIILIKNTGTWRQFWKVSWSCSLVSTKQEIAWLGRERTRSSSSSRMDQKYADIRILIPFKWSVFIRSMVTHFKTSTNNTYTLHQRCQFRSWINKCWIEKWFFYFILVSNFISKHFLKQKKNIKYVKEAVSAKPLESFGYFTFHHCTKFGCTFVILFKAW